MKELIYAATSYDFVNSIPNYGEAIGHVAALIVSGVDRAIATEMVSLCKDSQSTATEELSQFLSTMPKLADKTLFEGQSTDELKLFKSLSSLSDKELSSVRDPLNYLHFGRKPVMIVRDVVECEQTRRSYPNDFQEHLLDANRTLAEFTNRDKKASKW